MKPDDPTTPLDDPTVARLIESAGAREPIPAAHLDAIAAAARSAWERRAQATPERVDRSTGLLALAAAFLALIIGVAIWRSSRPSPSAIAPAEVATIATLEAATGPVYVEVAGADRPLEVGQPLALGAWVRTGTHGDPGEGPPARAALRLSSGAIIRLDAATTIRLSSPTLVDLARGALYADTGITPGSDGGKTAGAASALEVRTAIGNTRDIGTRFMVRLPSSQSRPALEVLVRDGAVALEYFGETDTAAAGEQLAVTRDSVVERSAISPYGPEWAWVMEAATPFDLEGRTVAEILEWMSRETGYTVRFEDAALGEAVRGISLQGGGDAEMRGMPAQVAFLVLPAAGLEGELQDGVLTVRRAR